MAKADLQQKAQELGLSITDQERKDLNVEQLKEAIASAETGDGEAPKEEPKENPTPTPPEQSNSGDKDEEEDKEGDGNNLNKEEPEEEPEEEKESQKKGVGPRPKSFEEKLLEANKKIVDYVNKGGDEEEMKAYLKELAE